MEKSKKVNAKAIRAGRCNIQREDVRELSFAGCTFDLATAFETIYFWPGLTESFAQVHRILRDGGRFFICNESDGDNSADTKREQMIQGMKIYRENEIVASLKQAGFLGVTVHRNPEKHWICREIKQAIIEIAAKNGSRKEHQHEIHRTILDHNRSIYEKTVGEKVWAKGRKRIHKESKDHLPANAGPGGEHRLEKSHGAQRLYVLCVHGYLESR
ncbi:MAG: class I SAM-dependent methyltransferase [Clostridiales bacterium]|nr:class I SAM-dependent methyltransferase [Clostridiales bacterium]